MKRRVAAILAVALLTAAALVALRGGDDGGVPGDRTIPAPPGVEVEPLPDPFAYDPDERETFERRAAAGNAHGLYVFSPGGIEASAARTAAWRDLVEDAADEAGVDADRLEGLILLESAGRDDALTGAGTEGAAGLTQIVAETAVNLLGMQVDVARSRRYTRRIARAARRGQTDRVRALRVARRRVDERYDPRKALAGTARYLKLAKERFDDSTEKALVSYHMGIGNLESVLEDYGDREAPYAQVYFDSTPLRHRAAHQRLTSLGDDSSNYLWKLYAAREVMRLYREDRPGLRRRAALHTAKNSAEEVLHPPASTPRFASPGELRDAWEADQIVALPTDVPKSGLRIDRRMGELAKRVDAEPSLYRGLRPEALALALYATAQVRAIAGADTSLILTSTVRDAAYQRQLVRRNGEATRNYSLHTTGYAFDVLRRYRDRRQALAFQFVLDRLRTLNVIAWVREPGAIHITVSRDAQSLLGLLDRVQSGG